MIKVKIVQIALAMAGDNAGGTDCQVEYLDNKGRVWYIYGHYEETVITVDQGVAPGPKEWVTEWKQLELPEEPEEGS